MPPEFPAPVVVARHLSPDHLAWRPSCWGAAPLEDGWAEDGGVLRPGTVRLAPPGAHLLVGPGGRLSLSGAPKVNFSRPSADVLFRCVAQSYGHRALAVVLTGSGNDGAAGVTAIKGAAGTVITQERATSEAFGMPSAAIATGCADFVLPLDVVPAALVSLTIVRWASGLFAPPSAVRAAQGAVATVLPPVLGHAPFVTMPSPTGDAGGPKGGV